MTEVPSPLLPVVYTPTEERLNVLSHALGLLLSIVGLVFLILRASTSGTTMHIIGFTTFGISLVVLYASSTLYHSGKNPGRRVKMRTIDHAAIYILIAGTYTPFTLTVLPAGVGWLLFGVSWGMAVAGIVLKLFYTGRFNLVSTLLYVFMGWIIVFAITPLRLALPPHGFDWLLAGGISYTVGAASYLSKRIPCAHALFHFFVLAGSVCHFVAVYWYILPLQ